MWDTQTAHLSVGTVFSSHCTTSPEVESQELSTLAAFITRIERLQDQVRQKDTRISELESAKKRLQMDQEKLLGEHHTLSLQIEIQNELLEESRHTSEHMDQLRALVKSREATIKDKVKALQVIERELDHHKLLLQAQIRRHATLRLHAPVDEDPLPGLGVLTKRADVDRWIEKLQVRLKKETPMIKDQRPHQSNQVLVANLRQEIDFYIREIIYYKLDIRGYKSDIKKLNKITAQMGGHGSRTSDLDSDTSSPRPAATPFQTCSSSTALTLGTSDVLSTVLIDPTSGVIEVKNPITPPPSSDSAAASKSPWVADAMKPSSGQALSHQDLQSPMTPQTPTRGMLLDVMAEAGHSRDLKIEPGVGPLLRDKELTVCERVASRSITTS
jgi:myosin heavy subunit